MDFSASFPKLVQSGRGEPHWKLRISFPFLQEIHRIQEKRAKNLLLRSWKWGRGSPVPPGLKTLESARKSLQGGGCSLGLSRSFGVSRPPIRSWFLEAEMAGWEGEGDGLFRSPLYKRALALEKGIRLLFLSLRLSISPRRISPATAPVNSRQQGVPLFWLRVVTFPPTAEYLRVRRQSSLQPQLDSSVFFSSFQSHSYSFILLFF